MKNKFLIVLILISLPAIYLGSIWNTLPVRLPIHFNFKGNIDKYGSKTHVLVITAVLTFLALLVYLLLSYIHLLNPKIASANNKDRMQKIAIAVVVFMVIIQCWMLYTIQKGEIAFSLKFVLIAVSLLFAVIGNYMPNLKPNYVAGLRLPWTLQNEENWRKTHDVAGKLWFAGGLLAAVLCILLPFKPALIFIVIIFIILFSMPAIYSYNLYKKEKY